MRGLECGFEVILSAMSADELMATKKRDRREALLSRFRRLLYSAKCIWPPHEIIRALVSAHVANPAQFDWTKVNVTAREYEAGIPRCDIDDELSAQQKKHQDKAKKDFDRMWKKLRPRLDVILAKDPSKRPTSYREAVAIAVMDGGVLWGIGRGLYKHVSVNDPSEADIRVFIDVCPPFRAACYGLVMAWYNESLRAKDGTARPGRNDLMMAAYLPYCSRFITADGPQRDGLREITTEARIDCEILSFVDFESSLAVVT